MNMLRGEKTFHPDTGLEVWATSLEARYPQKLCVAVAYVVLQVLHSQGLQPLPESISAIADSPLHRSQLTSVAISKQPLSGKIPPLIADFSRVQLVAVPSDEVVPVPVLSKLQKKPGAWMLLCHCQQDPDYSDAHEKLLGEMRAFIKHAMYKNWHSVFPGQ